MTTHIIQNGVVVNTIVATVQEAQAAFPDATCIEATTGGIGWLWDGSALSAPAAPPVVVTVPSSVTMRQACRALESAGLLDDVEAIVATLPRVYQIDWERASEVDRTNPLVEMVRQQQGMTDAQIDAIFIAAATL